MAIVLFRELTEMVPAPDLRGIGLQITLLRHIDIKNDSAEDPLNNDEEEVANSTNECASNVGHCLKRQGSMRFEPDATDILDCDDIYVPSQLDIAVVSSLPSPLQKRIFNNKRRAKEVSFCEQPPCAHNEVAQFTQVIVLWFVR